MKRTFLLLSLGAILLSPSLTKAQDDSSTPPPPPGGGPGGHHGMGFLTPAEKAELEKARAAAFAADPSLKTEQDALQASHQPGTPPSDADKEKFKAFQDKLDAAEIAADPAVAPIIAKIKAHHHGPGGPGGPGGDGTPPPPPPSSTSNESPDTSAFGT
jgi:hypothetical protein